MFFKRKKLIEIDAKVDDLLRITAGQSKMEQDHWNIKRKSGAEWSGSYGSDSAMSGIHAGDGKLSPDSCGYE